MNFSQLEVEMLKEIRLERSFFFLWIQAIKERDSQIVLGELETGRLILTDKF